MADHDPAVPTSDVVFLRGLDLCGDVVGSLDADEWELPSPCEGWSAKDVFGHLLSTMRIGLEILREVPPTFQAVDRPGDLVDDEPVRLWDPLAAELRQALGGADLASVRDTPFGQRTVADGLAFPAIDLYVHGWDISCAAGRPIDIPGDVIAFTHAYIDPFPVAVWRGPDGPMGPPVDPPPDATPTEAFIAWTGRDPR